MARPQRVRLGEALLQQNKINATDLEAALQLQKSTSRKLGKILVEQGYITEEGISEAISQQMRIPFVFLTEHNVDRKVTNKLTEIQARKFRAIVIKESITAFTIAMSDPADLIAYDEIQQILKKEMEVVCVTESDLMNYIDLLYKTNSNLQNIAQALEEDIKINQIHINEDLIVEDAPVIKLLQNLFDDATKFKASDIHIEPQSDRTLIRFRVNGQLIIHSELQQSICSPLISRLKIVSSLNISERRLPQDGRFQIESKNEHIDIRLSILPQYYGEMAVMRLLQKTRDFTIEQLGMPETIRNDFESIIQSAEGMILVVGPTGSGKTSTLYTGLSSINNSEIKIITIEDPVEYQLKMINQVAVNDKIGLDFSKVLRTVLRQDPDVIMIGEIRDTETAQIAMRAAITGHLIFSTLHTKDVHSVPTRLIDMGVPNYMVASALNGILSQRLVRINCPNCIEDYLPNVKEKILGEKIFGNRFNELTSFKHSKGCIKCNKTGFLTRAPIYEMLVLDDELKQYIQLQDWANFNKKSKEKTAKNNMQEHLFTFIKDGKTTVEEAFKLISN